MPSDIKECSLYSFTVHGVKTKTTPKDITARAAAEAAQNTANGKQDALTATQMDAVNSGITAAKVAGYDAFVTLFDIPKTIPSGSDLDDFTTVGHYSANSGNAASSLVNCPTTVNFSLFVIWRTSTAVSQIIIASNKNLFIRHQFSSGWGAWCKFTGV